MRTAVSRAGFLRGDFSGRSSPLRPPWTLPEAHFVERCNRCGACLEACPAGILEKGRGGFPQVNFSRGECTFCGACEQACTAGAFTDPSRRAAASRPWSVRAAINERCLARRAVECRSCADQCDATAIRFRLVVGGSALPVLDQASCSGCGACYAVCPVQAIELRQGDPGGV